MAKVITTNFDEQITIVPSMYFVCATDKFLSGWGCAEGRTAKRVIICNSYREAQRMADAFRNYRNSGMNYINICSKLPYYNEKRYKVTYSTFSDFSDWLKWTCIPE